MTAPAVAVGRHELLVAVVARVNEIAQVGAGQLSVGPMARLAILVGQVLVEAGVHEDVLVALAQVHDIEQVAMAGGAPAASGVEHLAVEVRVGEYARAGFQEVRVSSGISGRDGFLRRSSSAARLLG